MINSFQVSGRGSIGKRGKHLDELDKIRIAFGRRHESVQTSESLHKKIWKMASCDREFSNCWGFESSFNSTP